MIVGFCHLHIKETPCTFAAQGRECDSDAEQPAGLFRAGQPGEGGIGGVGTAACGQSFISQPVQSRERHTVFLVVQRQFPRLGSVDTQRQIPLGGAGLPLLLLCAVAGVERPDENAVPTLFSGGDRSG